MLISSINVDVQRHGLLIGQRQLIVKFAKSNTESPYNDIPQDGKEYTADEFLKITADLAKQKTDWICFTGGEPLLQIDYINPVLDQLSLPLYLETNGTLPKEVSEIKKSIMLAGVQLVPSFYKEFIDTLLYLNDTDYYVRLIIDKEITAKDVDEYAKRIAGIRTKTVLVLEPLFGCKNYLSFQAMALRHLSDVRVIPKMHL